MRRPWRLRWRQPADEGPRTRRVNSESRHWHHSAVDSVGKPMSWIERICWPGSIVGICDTGRAHRRLGRTNRVVAGGAITAVYETRPKCPGPLIIARIKTAFELHNGHSAFAAGRGLHAPLPSLPRASRKGSVGSRAVCFGEYQPRGGP